MDIPTHAERFRGIDRLYGQGSVERLARAHVCIVGIGGVGSWAVEALARSGIGRLTLIDADEVCISNTNRQLHALDGEFGKAKVGVMAARARAINPAIAIDAIEQFLTPANLATFSIAGTSVRGTSGDTPAGAKNANQMPVRFCG